MRRLRWARASDGEATVWRGRDEGQLVATVEPRGEHWGVTLHHEGEDDEPVDALYVTAESAMRKADHLLYG